MISKAIQGFCFLGDETLSLCNYLYSWGYLDNGKPFQNSGLNLSLNLVPVGNHCANSILDPLSMSFLCETVDADHLFLFLIVSTISL